MHNGHEKNTGGYAFASAAANDCASHVQEGMTLRDYFAGQALAGYQASLTDGCSVSHDACAAACYELADAMLAARGTPNDQ